MRDSSAHALKICEPRVRLKLLRRIFHPEWGPTKVDIRHLIELSLYLKIDKKQASVKSLAKRMIWVTALLLLVFVAGNEAFAQQKRVIQLSGVVLGEDSVSGLPGVHVYVPKAGRGTTTNGVGFFSMPVLVGDSIVISSVGYERQHFIDKLHHHGQTCHLCALVLPETLNDPTVALRNNAE